MMKSESWSYMMRLNGKNVCQALLITLGTPYFQVLCDGLLLEGKTTAFIYSVTSVHHFGKYDRQTDRHREVTLSMLKKKSSLRTNRTGPA